MSEFWINLLVVVAGFFATTGGVIYAAHKTAAGGVQAAREAAEGAYQAAREAADSALEVARLVMASSDQDRAATKRAMWLAEYRAALAMALVSDPTEPDAQVIGILQLNMLFDSDLATDEERRLVLRTLQELSPGLRSQKCLQAEVTLMGQSRHTSYWSTPTKMIRWSLVRPHCGSERC